MAYDTALTLSEARRLWQKVGRENLMIKIPAIPQSLAAFPELIDEGVNVNVTLLFSREMYTQVAHAYMAGLERRAARGQDLTSVASVASVFVSRIDSAVEALVEERLRAATTAAERSLLHGAGTARWPSPMPS